VFDGGSGGVAAMLGRALRRLEAALVEGGGGGGQRARPSGRTGWRPQRRLLMLVQEACGPPTAGAPATRSRVGGRAVTAKKQRGAIKAGVPGGGAVLSELDL